MNPNETIPEGASAPSSIDTTNPLDVQVGGSHYKQFPIQPAEFSERNGLTGLEFCVVKRVCRHSRGGKGRQDIEKAIHELQLLLEFHYPVSASSDAQGAPVEAPTNSADEDDKEERRELIDGIHKYARGFSGHPADAGMWRSVIRDYLYNHPTTKELRALCTSDLRRLSTSLNKAADARARGARDIKIRYRPAEGVGLQPGVRVSWTEHKTDPQNEKKDSENPKCEATDAKLEATPEFKKGDLVTYRGASYRVHGIDAANGEARIEPDLDPRHWIAVDLIVPIGDLTLAKTDSATAEPPVAEPKRGGEWPVRGARYTHPEHGESVFISSHPEDGALMVLEAYDAAADEHYYYGCESHKLTFASAGVSERIAENLAAKAKVSAPSPLVTADFSELELRASAHGSMSGSAGSTQNMPRSAEEGAMRAKAVVEEPPAAEPQSEAALKFKPGDGVYHRIRKTYGKVLQYPFGEGHLVGGLHFVAWTDGRNSVEHESDLLADPQCAESQSEAPKVVNTLNIDIGAGYAAMAKSFVRAITSPTRLLGKHPALGARYELGQGGIAGLNSDSPFRAGGVLDRGEATLPKGEEATAAGEAWTPKPGDRVRVVRKIKSHGGWKNYWVDLMDGAVGQVGRVKYFTDEDRRDNAVQLEFEGDPEWSDFWYPIPALERVTGGEC